jgi:hypothetical protein
MNFVFFCSLLVAHDQKTFGSRSRKVYSNPKSSSTTLPYRHGCHMFIFVPFFHASTFYQNWNSTLLKNGERKIIKQKMSIKNLLDKILLGKCFLIMLKVSMEKFMLLVFSFIFFASSTIRFLLFFICELN